jgi:hypothetical protein
LGRRYYRGGCHRSYPPLIRPAFYHWAKALAKPGHSGSPPRAFAHWEGFAPAATRRPSAHVSEPIWGLPLSRPLPVLGLVGRYPTNYLIGPPPILGRDRDDPLYPLSVRGLPALLTYRGLASVSRVYPRPQGRLRWYYSAVRQGAGRRSLRLAWVSPTRIAAPSGGFSQNCHCSTF